MVYGVVWLILFCAGCSAVAQPKSARTVAAYEVNLPSSSDKVRFLSVLKKAAEVEGYHVDSSTSAELARQSEVSAITFNASVWRGNDEESMASAMDFKDRIGRVWIAFPLGEDPKRSARFRDKLVRQIKTIWPSTASLPIMPNGAIPLTDDLVSTPSGYSVKVSAASKYKDETR